MNMRRTKTVSITSGKGGVGKTTLTANLAFALARSGRRVLIFDGDLGMANVDIMFGVKADRHIHELFAGEKSLQEIIIPLTPNIDLISGGSGIVEMTRIDAFQRRALVESVQSLENKYDYLLIDTAPGISDNVLYLNAAAQTSAIVINADPASIADSYALIKVLHQEYKENRFAIICNQVRDEADGLNLFHRFNEVVSRFLCVGLDYWGSVAQDPLFRKATQTQRLILKHEPTADSAHQLLSVSVKLERAMNRISDKSGLQFFWEQVVGVA
jgi:flagellar biosynthesis protein FlhG